jgi:hypothetical protein
VAAVVPSPIVGLHNCQGNVELPHGHIKPSGSIGHPRSGLLPDVEYTQNFERMEGIE